jgi:hypothetical protein
MISSPLTLQARSPREGSGNSDKGHPPEQLLALNIRPLNRAPVLQPKLAIVDEFLPRNTDAVAPTSGPAQECGEQGSGGDSAGTGHLRPHQGLSSGARGEAHDASAWCRGLSLARPGRYVNSDVPSLEPGHEAK